jgi:hypothetical protein
MKKIILFFSFLFCVLNLYSSEVVLNYTPGAFSIVTDKSEIVKTNYIFDNFGYFYMSRVSLSIFGKPNNYEIGQNLEVVYGKEKVESARKNQYKFGAFFDLMHDLVSINPIDGKHFEDGGVVHFITAASGLSFKTFTSNNFFQEFGIGLTYTTIFGNSFKEYSYAGSTDWLFKFGAGYRIAFSESGFINLGIDLTVSLFNSYHKVNDDRYIKFKHTGIYPYVGICF